MRKYELMTIFPLDEEKSKKALEDVRKVLTDFGAEIEKEELAIALKFQKIVNDVIAEIIS